MLEECPNCGTWVSMTKRGCPKCAWQPIMTAEQSKSGKLRCEKCGDPETAKISYGHKDRWLCFECKLKEDKHETSFYAKSSMEARYHNAIKQFYLKAMFLGRKPDYKRIETAYSDWLCERGLLKL